MTYVSQAATLAEEEALKEIIVFLIWQIIAQV